MLQDAARIAQHLACTLHGVPTCWSNRDGEALCGPGEGVLATFPTREALGFGVLMGHASLTAEGVMRRGK